VVWESVRAAVGELVAVTGRDRLDVLDAGGGTGGFAVPLAELGHAVTVVDASPDSLAALDRRAAEASVANRVRAVQGDAMTLLDVVEPATFDLVICHSVLEVVDDPSVALASVVACLRQGGLVSIVAANRWAVVLHRALAGRFDEAVQAVHDPLGRYAANDPTPRRFDAHDLEVLVMGAGLAVASMHGARVFADLLPGGVFDSDPQAIEALIALESAAAAVPAFRDIATQLHVVARRD